MIYDANVMKKLAKQNSIVQFMIKVSEGADEISKLSYAFNYVILKDEKLRMEYEQLLKKVDNSIKV